MTALQADAHGQVLLLRLLGGGQHAAHARRVGGHRLFHEDVLAGLDGGLEMNRPETGRRGQDHQVGPGGRSPFDRRRSRRTCDPRARRCVPCRSLLLLQRLEAAFQPVRKASAMAISLTLPLVRQGLVGRAGAAAAAADQRDLDLIVAGRVRAAGDRQAAGQRLRPPARRSSP